MKSILIAAAILAVLVSSGCTQTTKVYERKTLEVVTGYEDYLVATAVPEPPDATTYAKSNRDKKEDMLIRAWLEQNAALNSCNLDKKNVLEMMELIKTRINEHNAAEAARFEALKKENEVVK